TDAVTGTISVQVGAMQSNTLPFTVIIPTTSPVDEVIANVGTGAATKSVTINPDGTMAYTVSPEGNTVIPIDVENEQSLDAINVGDHPIAIVMHPTGDYAYVANFNSNSVSVICTNPDSTHYNEVVKTLIVGTNPIDLAISPTGDRVVTANAGANSLSFIDGDGESASHHTVVATVGTSKATKSVTINPDGSLIYVGTDEGYLVMDADDKGVVATVGTGKATKSLTINPDGSLLIILTTEGDVLIYNIDPNAGPNQNTVVATVGKGSGTKAVTINPDGSLLYLFQENSDEVIVVSLDIIGAVSAIEPGSIIPPFLVQVTVIDTVTAGANPSAGCFDPSGSGLLAITNAGDSTITFLNASSLPWDIVEADIYVTPRTLNLTSRGRWVTGSIELPPPLMPADIDISTVLLQDTVPAVPDKWEIADKDSNGVDELIVKFDRVLFQEVMPQGEYVPVTITGVAGTHQFTGDDTIRTIRPTVTHPSGGVVSPGLATTVTWESPSAYTVDYVDVHWSPDDGETWQPIAEGIPDGGSAAWLAPETQHLMCRVMVTLYANGTDLGMGMSPEPFSIAAPVAVSLVDFGGTIDKGAAVLKWRTTMESRVDGFHVLRSDTEEDGYMRVTNEVVPSAGDPEGSSYTYTDDGVRPNRTYYYMLEEVSDGGDKQLFGPCKVTYRLTFSLEQNHPNPFNPSTKIAFTIPADGHVTLNVYDVAGRLVRTLVDEKRRANRYTVMWDGRDNRGTPVASGVYFYRILAGKYRATKKMVVVK
ncbi:MAG: beta-propeller fold lactonase family protein, partial [bacterium]